MYDSRSDAIDEALVRGGLESCAEMFLAEIRVDSGLNWVASIKTLDLVPDLHISWLSAGVPWALRHFIPSTICSQLSPQVGRER